MILFAGQHRQFEVGAEALLLLSRHSRRGGEARHLAAPGGELADEAVLPDEGGDDATTGVGAADLPELTGLELPEHSLLRRLDGVGIDLILGHGDHLANDVMYLLFAGMVEDQAGNGGVLYYNRHDSGTEGLVYYKERVGFAAGDVEWVL